MKADRELKCIICTARIRPGETAWRVMSGPKWAIFVCTQCKFCVENADAVPVPEVNRD